MATRKKRRRRIKKTRPGTFLTLSLITLACIFAGVFIYYFSRPTPVIPPPPFEETYSIASHLSYEIRKIDAAIYEALYEKNVPEKNVLFLSVEHRKRGAKEWDFTELLIRLPNRERLLEIVKIIEKELPRHAPASRYQGGQNAAGEWVYRIYALNHCTHNIRLAISEPTTPAYQKIAKVAIIIDDLGYDINIAEAFMKLDLPIGMSVLPMSPYTKEIARKSVEAHRELLLHLPMEPKNYPRIRPGPGALLTGMENGEIEKTLQAHLNQMPGVLGVNNHMGSYFTERRDKMMVVLKELRRRHLFFLDSRTTALTVGFELARQMDVPTGMRSVFLDNDLNPKAIEFQFERLLGIARHSGQGIGIGHPHKATLRILRKYSEKLRGEVKLLPVSKLMS